MVRVCARTIVILSDVCTKEQISRMSLKTGDRKLFCCNSKGLDLFFYCINKLLSVFFL